MSKNLGVAFLNVLGIFGIQVDSDKLFRGIENRLSTVYCSL